ncbi:diguanylate cyclase domain-containing protein [Kineobactrum salinum]|uniref:Diguanylate cyclase n=1 Tax=Kineobactrum salinum TaxID=2708301 RepID=A0A6C0U4F1_9GAMM|nr:diguanylate cyclase [Kineobactrum salinum]QIB65265.1 diguanylate cyclase [Kineobactrum salinum]
MGNSSTVLVVTADQSHAGALQAALAKVSESAIHTEHAGDLTAAVARMAAGQLEAVLIDLNLPDSRGLATFETLYRQRPATPIIIFSDPGEDALAIEAVQRGAHGYLPKGNFGLALITRSMDNIIQRRKMEERLFIEKSRAQITLNSISDAVISTDMAGEVDYMNAAAEELTGWTQAEASGRHVSEVMQLRSEHSTSPNPNPIDLVLRWNKPMGLKAGTVLVRRDGSEISIEDSAAPIHDSEEALCGAVMVFHDISASRAMTEKMAYMAQHDFLTDLPNRVLLYDRINQAIGLAARRDTSLSVLFLDMDNFKPINDSLGHASGDKLLQSIARRLSSCVRSSDTVSRLGGDEFVLLLLGDSKRESPETIARKVLRTLSAPHRIDGHEVVVTASIGISSYPVDGTDAESLIKQADTAMYEAKNRGRDNYQKYCEEMNRTPAVQHAV